MKLSKNFYLIEFTRSPTAIRNNINNEPAVQVVNNLILLCQEVLQPLRDLYRKPITINSGYRSGILNSFINGSKTSQHVKGQAADIDTVNDNVELFNHIKDNLEFDQLLYEFGDADCPSWVHVSYKSENRNQILIAYNKNGIIKYCDYSEKRLKEIYK